MIAYHYLYLIAVGLAVIGWGARVYADDDVTIYHAPSSTAPATTASTAVAADGTPVVHKSLHRKKKKTVAHTGTTPADSTSVASSPPKKTTAETARKAKTLAEVPPPVTHTPAPPTVSSTAFSSVVPSSSTAATGPVTVTKTSPDSQTQITISPPTTHPAGPEVETGLPVARHSGSGYFTSSLPGSSLSRVSDGYTGTGSFPATSVSNYLPESRTRNSDDPFPFTDFERKPKNPYPWKLNIITTIFWIGEGSTPISSTDNVASAWDQDWRYNNGGTDSPYDRDGYASAHHAAQINPFYVALPFNDLAFPDKARRWLPAGWYRPPKDGKQVSACKDRWVEIKNAQGDVCYAQWEDVGPLRYDHAEYVFGPERPDTYTRAGLDVSPAVADYLNINERNRITRWRFVDDSDVQPGAWLKYDEEALLFKAMHDLKNDPIRTLPIQDAQRPIDDSTDSDANKKKITAAKG
jgi:hypothetical protein